MYTGRTDQSGMGEANIHVDYGMGEKTYAKEYWARDVSTQYVPVKGFEG